MSRVGVTFVAETSNQIIFQTRTVTLHVVVFPPHAGVLTCVRTVFTRLFTRRFFVRQNDKTPFTPTQYE